MKLDISFRCDMAVVSEEEIGLIMSLMDEIFEEMSRLDDERQAAILPNRKCAIKCPEQS